MRRARKHLWMVIAGGILSVGSSVGSGTPDLGAFSREMPGTSLPADWKPLTFKHIPLHTQYTLVRDAQAGVVLRAEARQSASGLMRAVNFVASEHPLLRWRWKAENLIAAGDVRRKEGDDYPARIYVSFRYAPERMSMPDRLKYEAARMLYGEYPPHAGLNYIWDTRAPVGTVAANPFTDRVKMIVVESGPRHLRQWRDYERDIVADYRLAFGEDPPAIAGIAVMTDADNTGESAVAFYGDISLSPRP